MSIAPVPAGSKRTAAILPAALILLSVLSGYVPVKLFSDIDFSFTGIWVYTVIALFGTRWGLAAAAAGSAAALHASGQPYGILLSLAEAAAVAWAVRSRRFSLTISVLAFWLVPGQIIVRLAYRFILHLPDINADLAVIKSALTSLGCAAVSSILIPYLYHYLLRNPGLFPHRANTAETMKKLSLHELFSNLIVVLLLSGMLAQLIYTTNRQTHDAEKNLEAKLNDIWSQFNDSLGSSGNSPDPDYMDVLSARYPGYRFYLTDVIKGGRLLVSDGGSSSIAPSPPAFMNLSPGSGTVRPATDGKYSIWVPDGAYSSDMQKDIESVYFMTGTWKQSSLYRLTVSYSPQDDWKRIYKDISYGMALIYDMIGLAIIIVFPVCRRLTRKLVLLSEQSARFTSKMGAGYKPEWSDSRFRELHTLSGSLRLMAEELNRQFDDMENRQLQLVRHAADASEELDRERKRLDGLLANIHDVVWSMDIRTDELLYISPACRELFGHPEAFFTPGINWIFKLVHEEDLPAFIAYFRDPAGVAMGYATIRFRIHHPDGTLRWIQDRSWRVLDADGRIIRIDGISTDITESVNAQDALLHLSLELSKQKERIEVQRNITQSILEATREGMLLCGRNGEVLFTNSRLRDFFGVYCEGVENIGQLFSSLPGLEPDTSRLLLEDLQAFLQKGSVALSFYRCFSYTIGHQVYYYSLYAESVTDSAGLEGSRLLVFRDRTEDELKEVMKEDLANQISHELRTPLTSILGFAEIMKYKEVQPERRKQYINTIYAEAVRLSRLVDDFLDLQRMEAGHQRYYFVPLDLRGIAADAVDNWGLEEKLRLHLELPDEPVLLLADADRIKQVLHNLISNAFKYSPNGTPVTVTVRLDNGLAYMDVQDEGIGIPEADKISIFRKFYRVEHADRRKIPGSGLGLSIVKEIVEAHKGEITFRSEHGAGSVFSVWMPAYTVPEIDGKHLLIVREEEYAKELTALLEEQGMPVLRLLSFEEAIHAIESGPGTPRSIAAGLVGAGLMNGLEFAARLRESSAGGCPLLFLEAMDRSSIGSYREKAWFMNRSFSSEELLHLIRTDAGERNTFHCYFPIQDPVELLAQLSKFGLVPESLTEEGAGLLVSFPL